MADERLRELERALARATEEFYEADRRRRDAERQLSNEKCRVFGHDFQGWANCQRDCGAFRYAGKVEYKPK